MPAITVGAKAMDSPAFERTQPEEGQPAPAQAGDLFDGTPAAPPRVKDRNELNSAQQATLDRLMRHPASLLDINKLRIEQVTKHGHSDESDAEERLVNMIGRARERLTHAMEYCGGNEANNFDYIRRKLAISAALSMAAMDWIDNFQPKKEN
jgi:hypothetical protein